MCTSELLCGTLREVQPTSTSWPPLHERLLTTLCRLLQEGGIGGTGAAGAPGSALSTGATPRASMQQSTSSLAMQSAGGGGVGSSLSLTVSLPMPSGSATSLVDPVLISTFLAHSWFFLELIAKSAGLHLLASARIRMLRNERFPKSFTGALEAFVGLFVDWLLNKAQTESYAVQSSNESLARFIRVRVYSLWNYYILVCKLIYSLSALYIANNTNYSFVQNLLNSHRKSYFIVFLDLLFSYGPRVNSQTCAYLLYKNGTTLSCMRWHLNDLIPYHERNIMNCD